MATTNCADPHAMPGNEGGYNSVDAMIATNAPQTHKLNAAQNSSIACVIHQSPKHNPSSSHKM